VPGQPRSWDCQQQSAGHGRVRAQPLARAMHAGWCCKRGQQLQCTGRGCAAPSPAHPSWLHPSRWAGWPGRAACRRAPAPAAGCTPPPWQRPAPAAPTPPAAPDPGWPAAPRHAAPPPPGQRSGRPPRPAGPRQRRRRAGPRRQQTPAPHSWPAARQQRSWCMGLALRQTPQLLELLARSCTAGTQASRQLQPWRGGQPPAAPHRAPRARTFIAAADSARRASSSARRWPSCWMRSLCMSLTPRLSSLIRATCGAGGGGDARRGRPWHSQVRGRGHRRVQ